MHAYRVAKQPTKGDGDLIVSYNALLKAYCKCQCLKEAVAAYRSMPGKGLTPTLRTINTLMSGYAQVPHATRQEVSLLSPQCFTEVFKQHAYHQLCTVMQGRPLKQGHEACARFMMQTPHCTHAA